jgi:hypothetical protein
MLCIDNDKDNNHVNACENLSFKILLLNLKVQKLKLSVKL